MSTPVIPQPNRHAPSWAGTQAEAFPRLGPSELPKCSAASDPPQGPPRPARGPRAPPAPSPGAPRVSLAPPLSQSPARRAFLCLRCPVGAALLRSTTLRIRHGPTPAPGCAFLPAPRFCQPLFTKDKSSERNSTH